MFSDPAYGSQTSHDKYFLGFWDLVFGSSKEKMLTLDFVMISLITIAQFRSYVKYI